MTKSFDIEIHGNIVNRERAQYGDATQMAAVRELVDNCVDAGATMVEITFDSVNSTITIKDDGRTSSASWLAWHAASRRRLLASMPDAHHHPAREPASAGFFVGDNHLLDGGLDGGSVQKQAGNPHES